MLCELYYYQNKREKKKKKGIDFIGAIISL